MAKLKISAACSLIYLCLLILLSRGAVAASNFRGKPKREKRKKGHTEAKRGYLNRPSYDRVRGAGPGTGVIKGNERLRKKQKIIEDQAPSFAARSPNCNIDDDCRVFSNYCGGCNCDVLLSADPDPVCDAGVVFNCLINPCDGVYAPCVEGFCTQAECPAYDYKAKSQEECSRIKFFCDSGEYFNIEGCGCGCKPVDSNLVDLLPTESGIQACPRPSEPTACAADLPPVICSDGCEYSSECEAVAAGQVSCKKKEGGLVNDETGCPKPVLDGIACIALYDPIVCEGGCTYNNKCLASAAGFDSCVPSGIAAETGCPEVPPGSKCTRELVPVTCLGECEYDNSCIANSAGFDETMCKLSLASLSPRCPDSDGICPDLYDPVVCEGGCQYSNDCHARAAGFDLCVKEVDLREPRPEPLPEPLPVELPEPPPVVLVCPEAGPTGLDGCVKEFIPVICDGCEYPNQCVAGFAGFPEESCLREPLPEPPPGSLPDPDIDLLPEPLPLELDCPEADLDGIACIALYDPVVCEGGCKYSNDCHARAAGQNLTLCSKPPLLIEVDNEVDLLPALDVLPDDLRPIGAQTIPALPSNPADCPLAISEVETECDNFFLHEPVICDDRCIYRNKCAAEEVSTTSCEPVTITENAACSSDDDCMTLGSDCYPCSCKAISKTQVIPFCDALDGNCDKDQICEGRSVRCNEGECEVVE